MWLLMHTSRNKANANKNHKHIKDWGVWGFFKISFRKKTVTYRNMYVPIKKCSRVWNFKCSDESNFYFHLLYKCGQNQFCSSFLFQWRSTHLFAILVMLIVYKDICLGFHSCQWHLESLIFVENGHLKKHFLYEENFVDSVKNWCTNRIPADLKSSTTNLVWVAHWQYYTHEN